MRGWGCQSGCERRSDAFLKIIFFFGGGGGGGGQGGCDRRSEVFVKIKKIFFFLGVGGGSGWGLPIRGWGGGGGSKVWGRWVMWGMGDVNKE